MGMEKNETTHSLTTWNCLSPMRRTCGADNRSGRPSSSHLGRLKPSASSRCTLDQQKSLFDHLIEDVQTLNAIAKEIEAEEFRSLSRIQKTFVISRRTLVCLDDISRQFSARGMPWWSIRSSGCFRSSTANARNTGGARSCLPKSISIPGGLKLVEKSVSVLARRPVSSRLAAAMEAYTSAGPDRALRRKSDVIEEF